MKTNTFDIISFGSGLIDFFAYTDVKEKKGFLEYPIGAKIQIKDLFTSIGGGGVNTSTTFSRMQLKTGMLTKLGKDDNCKKILDFLKNEKIDFLGKTEGTTGCSIILDSKEHDRTILTFKGANDHLKFSEIKNLDAKWFYFSSLQGESFESQIKLAQQKKSKIAFNPSQYLLEMGHASKLIKYTDVLILNNEEADMINKDHKSILNLGPKILIVTNGKKPFYCYTRDKLYRITPHQNQKIVERTGAGDAFASGFLASFIKTNDIEKSLQIGVVNSESVIRYLGSTNKILTWREALKEISEKPCKIEEI